MTDGEHIEYFDSGDIWCKCNYLGGKGHGEYIDYYLSGEILSKSMYLDGERHGEYIRYYKSGEITYKYYYIYGKSVTKLDCISYNRNIKLELLGL